jgi:hypothetical protein
MGSTRLILIGLFYTFIGITQATVSCEPFANEISPDGAVLGK